MNKINDCNKCPYYGSYYDSFIGDGDEWCECGLHKLGEPLGCKLPLVIRHILAWKEKIRQAWYDRQAQIAYEKELDETETEVLLAKLEKQYKYLVSTDEELAWNRAIYEATEIVKEMKLVNNVKEMSTCELVEELKKREGVKYESVKPYEDKTVEVNGSAIVLIIVD